MARGKIQIKKIENQTNRQVTYSKRRNGLFKKAEELTVLCDAQVSIIMVSCSGKVHEYISPSTTTKQIYDRYQKFQEIDLWNTHYMKMQEKLEKLRAVNRNLVREIRQRMGDCLNDLSLEHILSLQEEMEAVLKLIRERKVKVITGQIETKKKKVRNEQEIYRHLLRELAIKEEDPHYGFVDNGAGDYDSMASNIFALRLQPNHHLNLHSGAGSDLTAYTLLDYKH